MTLNQIFAAAAAVGAIAAAISCAMYMITYSRVTWWRSATGRVLMFGAAVTGSTATLSALSWASVVYPGPTVGFVRVALAVSWLAVAAKYLIMRCEMHKVNDPDE